MYPKSGETTHARVAAGANTSIAALPVPQHFIDVCLTDFPVPLLPEPMMRGDFTNLSERKLMDCLNRLGYDIEIKVRPASEPVGHLTLSTAPS